MLPGAGAFEIAAYMELMKFKNEVKGRARLGNYQGDILCILFLFFLLSDTFLKHH